MKHLVVKSLIIAMGLVSTQALAAKNEPPLVDLGAELKARSGDIPKKGYTPAPRPVKPMADSMATDSAGTNQAQTKKVAEKPKTVEWSYSGKTGPKFWGDLSAENALCSTGKNQSPIDLRDKAGVGTTGLPQLDIHYRDVPYKVVNTGKTIQVNYPLGSYIKVGNHRYELMNYKFHTPSQHKKEGFNYPMELQMVHRDGDGNQTMMAVLFQEGEYNEQLQTVIDHLPKKINKQQIHKNISLNPVVFMPGNTDFYKYSGSLTTPPCSEGVYWMVFKHTIEASAEQLQAMNEAMGENARPVQPLNARAMLKSWADQLQEPQLYEFY